MVETRKHYLEEIIGDVHSLRRKFAGRMRQERLGRSFKSCPEITASQWAVLITVMHHEQIGITDLAKALDMTTSAATQLVDELTTKGFLVRARKIGDRRALTLSLSGKYKNKISAMRKRYLENFSRIFEPLTDEEVKRYAILSNKIAKSLLNQ